MSTSCYKRMRNHKMLHAIFLILIFPVPASNSFVAFHSSQYSSYRIPAVGTPDYHSSETRSSGYHKTQNHQHCSPGSYQYDLLSCSWNCPGNKKKKAVEEQTIAKLTEKFTLLATRSYSRNVEKEDNKFNFYQDSL